MEFYADETGCPVQQFLDGLDRPKRAKVLALIRLLEEEGPTLPFPYSSQVSGKLRELRTRHADDRLRVLYFGSPLRVFVLLHAFTKRTDTIPLRDIQIADARMKKHLEDHREQQKKR
ncbi:MAG: type II toxin-antitoxin system RelE/ParE family toxin [bacterium]